MKNKEIADVLVFPSACGAHMYKALKYLRSRLISLDNSFLIFMR
jgi:hypothetical protein